MYDEDDIYSSNLGFPNPNLGFPYDERSLGNPLAMLSQSAKFLNITLATA